MTGGRIVLMLCATGTLLTIAPWTVGADDQPQPDQWLVFLDPAGHPVCLTSNIPFDLPGAG